MAGRDRQPPGPAARLERRARRCPARLVARIRSDPGDSCQRVGGCAAARSSPRGARHAALSRICGSGGGDFGGRDRHLDRGVQRSRPSAFPQPAVSARGSSGIDRISGAPRFQRVQYRPGVFGLARPSDRVHIDYRHASGFGFVRFWRRPTAAIAVPVGRGQLSSDSEHRSGGRTEFSPGRRSAECAAYSAGFVWHMDVALWRQRLRGRQRHFVGRTTGARDRRAAARVRNAAIGWGGHPAARAD